MLTKKLQRLTAIAIFCGMGFYAYNNIGLTFEVSFDLTNSSYSSDARRRLRGSSLSERHRVSFVQLVICHLFRI